MPEEYIPNAITLAYALDFGEPIWQIRFDEGTGWIAIEGRDPDALQVTYQVVAATTGKVLLQNYSSPNSWWTGLAELKDGLLFLHLMGAAGLGQANGLIALAIDEGEIKWQRQDYSYYGLTEEKLFARPVSAGPDTLIGLNIETGLITDEEVSFSEIAAGLESFRTKRAAAIQVPQHYPNANSYFNDLSQFVLAKTGFNALWAIDYLETQNLLIIGFYPELAHGNKTYWVAVLNHLGKLLFLEELGKSLTGLGTDNFFVFKEKLFLLKDKKSLLAFSF